MSQDTTAPGAQADTVDDATVERAETVAVVQPGLLARLGAEVFGTFFLVLAIVGVALYNFLNQGSVLLVALSGGIAVLAGIAAVGNVSGGHFNPAVTLGAAIGGRTAWSDVLPYWVAQVVGGLLAGLVLLSTIPAALPELLGRDGKGGLFVGTANGFDDFSPLSAASQGGVTFGLVQALLVETIVTAVFVGVILGVTDKRANARVAPVAIGLALTALIIIAAPVTNASLNPARSLASAVFAGDGDLWAQQWVFWVAPLLGAAIAGLFYRAFAFSPAQDDLLGEDQVVTLTDESELPAGATVTSTVAGAAAGATAAAATATEAPAAQEPEVEVVAVEEVVVTDEDGDVVAVEEVVVTDEDGDVVAVEEIVEVVETDDVTPDEGTGEAPKA